MNDHIRQKLEAIGKAGDADIDIASAALSLAQVRQPETALQRFEQHLQKLADAMETAVAEEILSGTPEDVLTRRIQIINHVLYKQFSYAGDVDGYDNIENGNLFQVIDRRRGIPVALGILYIHLARSQSWQVEGLNFPGHFLLRMEHQGVREIIDPFYGGQTMDAARMRQLAKTVLGDGAELDHAYYNPLSNRDILLRLQNNLKIRFIEGEDYTSALDAVKTMQLIAPEDNRLPFDAGVLNARCGFYEDAIKQLQLYIDRADDQRAKYEAQSLMMSIQENM